MTLLPPQALPDDALSCIVASLLRCDSLRVWQNVAEDLLNLRLTCTGLRSKLDAAGFPRLEAALIAYGEGGVRNTLKTLGPESPIQAPSLEELPTLTVAGTTYKRPSAGLDALLRSPGPCFVYGWCLKPDSIRMKIDLAMTDRLIMCWVEIGSCDGSGKRFDFAINGKEET